MSADRGSRTASLPLGYTVRDVVIHRGTRLIGITHAHSPHSDSVVLFCGGDTFHRSIEGGEALEALALDADVVLFDYPGYGDSTGSPSTALILDTALAAYDYAMGLQTSAGRKRVVYGFSLGGLVAAHVARDRQVDGVVLEATSPNVASWARSQVPWLARPLVTPRIEPALGAIDAVAALRGFRGKVLVLASRTDQQAPAALSVQMERQLRQAGVNVRLVEFPRAAHGGIDRTSGFSPVLRHFLNRLQEPQWVSALR
jgi:pimeloyl-ACP methyl ester carboxylesterase